MKHPCAKCNMRQAKCRLECKKFLEHEQMMKIHYKQRAMTKEMGTNITFYEAKTKSMRRRAGH